MGDFSTNTEDNALADLKSRIAENVDVSMLKNILDDALLFGFLSGKRFNVDEAFNCLVIYVHVRRKKYKTFTQLHRPLSVSMLDVGKVKILKHKDQHGNLVAFDQPRLWDPTTHGMQQVIAEAVLVIDEILRSSKENSDGNKLVVIVDCTGLSFYQARQVSPGVIMQTVDILQNSIPIRPYSVHLLNEGRIVRGLYQIIKPFLKAKLKNRIHFHSTDLSSLHNHVTHSILPKSLGGLLPDLEAFDDTLTSRIRSHDEFYKQLAA